MSWLSSENGTEVEELEDAFHDDGNSAVTYESDTDKKAKKKKISKPPRSQSSPYLSSAGLRPKKAPVWRSLKGTGQMHTENPTAKVPRQLWLASVKQGNSLTQPLKSDTDIGQAWVSPGSSTPEYLKEALGMKKPKYSRSSSNGYIPGTPDFKEKEEMYDQILDLKKTIQAQKSDSDVMKTKLRRLEEENNRKDRQIEQLLDPSSGSEFTRSLVDKKNDNSLLTNHLKQKILKLERQCKDKDGALSKLQADLKTTNQEEMRIAMETYYEEIQRLQLLLAKAEAQEKKPPESKDSLKREKAMKMALMKLSKQVQELQEENRSLKTDLDKAMAQSPTSSRTKGYNEWSKPRLVRKISELEKKLEMAEKSKPSLKEEEKSAQLVAVPNSDQIVGAKPDLAEECERLRNVLKKVKEDRSALQERLAARESDFKKAQQEKTDLEGQLQRLKERKDEREEINRLAQKIKRLEAELEDEKREKEAALEAMKKAQKESPGSHLSSGRNTSRVTSHTGSSGGRETQKRQEAAKVIQKNWRQYNSRKGDNSGVEEATVFLQAALRGHLARQKMVSAASAPHAKSLRANQLSQEDNGKSKDLSQEEEDPVTLLQSAFRAHLTRTQMLGQGTSLRSSEIKGRDTPVKKSHRNNWSSLFRTPSTQHSRHSLASGSSEESDEPLMSEEEDDRAAKRPPSRSSPSKPPSALGKAQKPVEEELSDDSDDIITSPSQPARRKDSNF